MIVPMVTMRCLRTDFIRVALSFLRNGIGLFQRISADVISDDKQNCPRPALLKRQNSRSI